ncbi:aromatic ring-hydroxylating dioxygenase subunit alpha [Aliiglaciecola sp. 3_MG-2023]|uniref:aromatic ring-hydroxylating oxygenase subunit alpha n=1 Tax=Aliiglaciecola sp. 3_MG-2023 TaxID=3062644 RepID=UPI0026E1FF79|nr:aromatic ring-hydroxylating dioxygenase subunit alpha [Aliiglaciecola sp. 3_MG-2023]MDO6694505.1 aromatic ring-hydroxylating dioxygenase subunit alpha [Aliiglaciecola sp. 3_MG-2023]
MSDITQITSEHISAHGLPASVFKDSTTYDMECDKLFAQGWASIGCAQQISKPGDILPIRIAGQSLIAMRNKNGEIGVFHNVCRHKAAPLVDEPCNKRSLVCPYHKWTFKIDGNLLSAPRYFGSENKVMSEEDKADKSLISVRFAVWWDIIFVNIDGKAEPFEDFIRPLDEQLSNYPKDDIHLTSSTDYSGEVNWKLAVDNFLDGYHVPFVHSQACTLDSVLDQQDLFLSDNIVGLHLANGASAKPAKTAKQLPHFNGLAEDKRGTQQWFGIFPNTLFFVDPCWVQTIVIKPMGATQTAETLNIYVVNEEAASEEYAAERETLNAVLNEVNQQDIELLDKLQVTRSNDIANQGHLNAAWDQVNMTFHQMWLKKMTAQANDE